MKLNNVVAACVLIVSSLISCESLVGQKFDKRVDFAREILPVLSEKCFVCHGPAGEEKDVLRLDSFAAATRDLGGHRGIDTKEVEKSAILLRINDNEDPMPPKDSDRKLSQRERELMSRWVRQGGKYAKHWAFVPPRKRLPSSGDNAVQSDSEIDSFVRARLQEKGLTFAPDASRAIIARRAALVLTGLPPEPKQLATFLADQRPNAYERLIDELLASSRFGEHQARYWLDAVRYGDTHGLHLDNRRGIYPYRDWVVNSLNTNLPLDDFITWQLAGDLMASPTLAQRVATGFVRMNPTTAEGGAIPAEFQAKNNFDRTESLGTVLLGMTLTCARCHTHKYDPIPQTEYYRLLAFFNSTAEKSMDGNSYTYGPVIKAPKDQLAWKEWRSLETARDRLLTKAQAQVGKQVLLSQSDEKKWQQGQQARLLVVANPKSSFVDLQKQAKELVQRIVKAEKGFTTTLVAQDLATPRKTYILQRGEYNLPIGDPLEAGVPAVMGAFPKNAPQNRLGLARWLTARDHPLVARVLINRVWQRTFGDALVRTPEDFGLQGQQPTHPLLLDWLAVELHESGWDLKHMLRLMVTSRTFRQSSAWRAKIDDPENRLLARGPSYRLDAEVVRDVALWASGLLDPHMGGEGVKPYQPAGMWLALAHPGSNTKRYVKDKGLRLYRRSLYVYWKRTSPHPMMTLFDAPSREASCVKRSRTNTSLQSLGLLNETQRLEMSRMLAERLLREASDDKTRINLLFTLLACRKATANEFAACNTLLQTLRRRYANSKSDAVALLSTGDAPRNQKLDPAEHAAWSQLAITVLASDIAILLY